MKKEKDNKAYNVLFEMDVNSNQQFNTYQQGALDAWKDLFKKLNPPPTGGGPQGPQPPQPPQPDRPDVNQLDDVPTPNQQDNQDNQNGENGDQDNNQQNQNDQQNQNGQGQGQSQNGPSQEEIDRAKQRDANAEASKETMSKDEIEENARKAAQETKEFVEGYKKGLIDAKNGIDNDGKGLSEEQQRGYRQAQREVKDFQEKTTPKVDQDGDRRFGADRISKEEMDKIANHAGQPVSSQEGSDEDPDEYAKQWVEKKLSDPDFGQSRSKTPGKGVGSLRDKMKASVQKLQSNVNWKNKLKTHFNKASKSKHKVSERTFYVSRVARDAINQFVKDKPIAGESKNAISQIFYTVDGSGSMFSTALGKDIFYYIMNEILSIEESTEVKASSFAYFTDGLMPNAIKNGQVKRWLKSSSRGEKMKKIAYDENSGVYGGTNIVKAIKDIYKLPKPYFDNTPSTGTLLVLITDAGDYLKNIASLPLNVKRNLIFVTVEQESVLKATEETLKACGIPPFNIVSIDTDKVAEQLKGKVF